MPYPIITETKKKTIISLIEQVLKDSLTSMLDVIEKSVKENNPAYDREALDTNNNRRWYEQGFGENKQEVINIINSHR